jgi:hypothetical protein
MGALMAVSIPFVGMMQAELLEQWIVLLGKAEC